MEQSFMLQLGDAALSLRDFLEVIEERIELHRRPLSDGRQVDQQSLSALKDVAEQAEHLITALEMAKRHAIVPVYRQ